MGRSVHGNVGEDESQRDGTFSGTKIARETVHSVLIDDFVPQELLNMEKNRNVSLTDNKSNKKKGKSKKKEQNGSAGTSGEGGSGGGKEKCQVM